MLAIKGKEPAEKQAQYCKDEHITFDEWTQNKILLDMNALEKELCYQIGSPIDVRMSVISWMHERYSDRSFYRSDEFYKTIEILIITWMRERY